MHCTHVNLLQSPWIGLDTYLMNHCLSSSLQESTISAHNHILLAWNFIKLWDWRTYNTLQIPIQLVIDFLEIIDQCTVSKVKQPIINGPSIVIIISYPDEITNSKLNGFHLCTTTLTWKESPPWVQEMNYWRLFLYPPFLAGHNMSWCRIVASDVCNNGKLNFNAYRQSWF